MFKFILSLFSRKPTPFTGVVVDPRSRVEKAQDYTSEEIATASPVVWRVKPQAEWKKYSVRNQDGSSSCVAQSFAKVYEVLTGVIASAHPLYRRRSNFSNEGMWPQNCADIFLKQGTTTEALNPSQNQTESEMNRSVTVSTPLKIGGYFKMTDPKDIDAIAQVIEQHKAVAVLFRFNYLEWTPRPVKDFITDNLGHEITAVDYTIDNGEKCLVIDDSWGLISTYGTGGQRIITESFLKESCYEAIFCILPAKPTDKPKHLFTRRLSFGLKNDIDVKALQAILTFEKFFIADKQYHTGNMLQMTCRALKKWQLAHNIMDFQYEKDVRNVAFGPKSIALMNSMYG